LQTFRGSPLAAEKTRLIKFGRFARDRQARRPGQAADVLLLGFSRACAKTRKGRFMLKHITERKRMRAKLRKVKAELRRRTHLPIPEQGLWLGAVFQGHLDYYAVPSKIEAIKAFRDQVTRYWYQALRRPSQRHRLDWKRMHDVAQRWLPPAKIVHPWPGPRSDARIQAGSPVS
jgi:hypothetical protein